MTKIEEAVLYATRMHSGQKRKLTYAPYILHPLEAAVIVESMTSDEDLIIAALLHDVIEDTDAKPEEIEARFGKRVLSLVKSETENKRRELPASATWQIRKEESLEELREANVEVKVLWLADKLSNVRSIAKEYLKNGDIIFDVFNEKDKKKHEWYYRTIADLLRPELGSTLAFLEYERLVNIIFDK